MGKKDLGLLATMYGHVYVARVAFGAKMAQTAQAFLEAEAYPGPSLIVAYSHCIAHGYDMAQGAAQQKRAVESGVWPLYRFDPARLYRGEPPLHLDYAAPKGRSATTCATSRASAWSSARTPSATRSSSRTRKRRPGAATSSTSSWPGSACRRPSRRRSAPPPAAPPGKEGA